MLYSLVVNKNTPWKLPEAKGGNHLTSNLGLGKSINTEWGGRTTDDSFKNRAPG